MKYWIGFDLGGTKMLAAVVDSKNNIVARKKKKTRAHEGSQAAVDRIVETIGEVVAEAGITFADVAGIGIGSPGPLELDTGVVLSSPNLGWENLPLRAIVEKKTGCATVVINDVDAGVYGEYLYGAGKGARCVVGVFPGTGIGGGCVYNGELLRGTTTSCMEIGHMQMVPNGPRCGCGRLGCLEALASRLAVAAQAAAAAARGEAPALLEASGGAVPAIKSGMIADAIRNGDKSVELIVKNAANWLGRAVASSVNLLAPDVVVLGGGMVEAMPELFVAGVSEVLKDAVIIPYGKGGVPVKAAQLMDDAGVLGAAGWAKRVIGEKE